MKINKKTKLNQMHLIRNLIRKFNILIEKHFHMIMYTLVSLVFIGITLISVLLISGIRKTTERISTFEQVEVVEKLEIRYHLPEKHIVILKCEHEIFFVDDKDLYNKARDGEVFLMRYTEKRNRIYYNGKIINDELEGVEYNFKPLRYDKDDGIFSKFKLFKKSDHITTI